MKRAQFAVKRLLDMLVAALALVVLLPCLLIVAVCIRWSMGRPVLFWQVRAGRGGKPFWIVKFRTMRELRDAQGQLLPDAQRLTRLGRFLRKTSLDELPQLWNVLRGEMSLVGPRPLLLPYVDRYTPRQRKRLQMRPGITGWAQVNGRQAITFSRRLEMDVWYVEHFSLGLDLVILARTVWKGLCGRGVVLEQSLAEVDDLGLAHDLPPSGACEPELPPSKAA